MGAIKELTGAAVDLESARTMAVRAAESAGGLLTAGANDGLGIHIKSATGDVVTDLDLAAERLIVDRIRTAYPRHRIIAEESGLLDAGDGSWSWLVDPLDGTNNLAIGLSNYAVGIALCHLATPVLGVVHDPVHSQTWSAVIDKGTTGPSGSRVRTRFRRPKHAPVLAWAQGYAVGRGDRTAQALRLVLESRSRRVLQLWAPLLAWVMLARGDIDGFVGYRAEAVDLPAGSLIAREAGVLVRDFDGRPFDERIDRPGDLNFVAGPPWAIDDLLDMVRAAGKVSIDGISAGRPAELSRSAAAR
jgi:myo-inositol-1(or 4)-monophosphatase